MPNRKSGSICARTLHLDIENLLFFNGLYAVLPGFDAAPHTLGLRWSAPGLRQYAQPCRKEFVLDPQGE